MIIQKEYSLKNLNTFHINATARFFTEINSIQELLSLINEKEFVSVNKLILGGGSNILFSGDYDGLVIKNNISGIEVVGEDKDHVEIKVGSGVNWHYLVEYALSQKWYGLENLALIPGTVGASPIQNIGAYGVELKDFFVRLEAIDLSNGRVLAFDKDQCDFGYRYSVFKGEFKNKIFIAEVILRLYKKPLINISYRALQDYFIGLDPKEITPERVFSAVVDIRQSKLPDPEVIGNGGSFFKNPVIRADFFERLKKAHQEIPYYDNGDENIKIPAAFLIQSCGWKGYRDGDAGVHKYQALVLVNHGNAGGNEIVELSKKIQNSVYQKFHIRLEPEVNII